MWRCPIKQPCLLNLPVATVARRWNSRLEHFQNCSSERSLTEVLVVVHQVGFADDFEAFVAEYFGGRVDILDVDGD